MAKHVAPVAVCAAVAGCMLLLALSLDTSATVYAAPQLSEFPPDEVLGDGPPYDENKRIKTAALPKLYLKEWEGASCPDERWWEPVIRSRAARPEDKGRRVRRGWREQGLQVGLAVGGTVGSLQVQPKVDVERFPPHGSHQGRAPAVPTAEALWKLL
jgi:hypothetical protein